MAFGLFDADFVVEDLLNVNVKSVTIINDCFLVAALNREHDCMCFLRPYFGVLYEDHSGFPSYF